MKTASRILPCLATACVFSVQAQFNPIHRNAYTTNSASDGWKAMQEYLAEGPWVVMSQNGNKWQIGVNLADPVTNNYTRNLVLKGATNHVTGDLTVAGTLYVSTYSGNNSIPLSALQASGSPGSGTFLRGDGAWASIPEGGTIDYVDTADPTRIIVVTNGTTYTINVGNAVALRSAANTFTATNQFNNTVHLNWHVLGMYTNTAYPPKWAIDTDGVFHGNAGGMSNFPAANLSGVLLPSQLPSIVAYLPYDQTFSGKKTFSAGAVISDSTLEGQQSGVTKWKIEASGLATLNGANITNLNASELRSGTVPVARLPSTVARTDVANTFTANQTVNGTVTATTFVGSGSGLTGIPVTGLQASGTPTASTVLYGDGSWRSVPVMVYSGTGSPEGAVAAAAPAIYYSSAGGVWVKSTGTGATGWSPVVAE